MVTHSEQYPLSDPTEQFHAYVLDRKERLDYLYGSLTEAIGVVSDQSAINETIKTSSRPDLVMTERVDQLQLGGVHELELTNNFKMYMKGFGIRVFEEGVNWKGEPETRWVGRRQLNDEEKAMYFLLGGRGEYNEFHEFAQAHGIDPETCTDMMMQTQISKKAFMRMWILLPELTENLMNWCLDEVGNRGRSMNEELFVAYSIMSKLVDANDPYVRRENGVLDDWSLCR